MNKKFILPVLASLISLAAQSQTSEVTVTQKQQSDTLQVGDIIIIKENNKTIYNDTVTNNEAGKKVMDIDIYWGKKKAQEKPKAKSRNYITFGVFDLGFANYIDNTNYATAQAGSYFKTLNAATGAVNNQSTELIMGKSSNVNIWVFMQQFNIPKTNINFKYGLGYEMYNFRFRRSLSFRENPSNYIFNDTVHFSKNKLYAGYISLPIMLNYHNGKKRSPSFGLGVNLGYLVSARNKQISTERGKEKIRGGFDLNPLKVSAVTELGLGPVTLYGSYNLTPLFKENTGLNLTPYAIGIRLGNR